MNLSQTLYNTGSYIGVSQLYEGSIAPNQLTSSEKRKKIADGLIRLSTTTAVSVLVLNLAQSSNVQNLFNQVSEFATSCFETFSGEKQSLQEPLYDPNTYEAQSPLEQLCKEKILKMDSCPNDPTAKFMDLTSSISERLHFKQTLNECVQAHLESCQRIFSNLTESECANQQRNFEKITQLFDLF